MKYLPINNQLFTENRKKFSAQLNPNTIAIFNSNDVHCSFKFYFLNNNNIPNYFERHLSIMVSSYITVGILHPNLIFNK